MIVTIHQPLFFPWAGYLHRMAQADLFIVLDHVQFERANYQNRARIRMRGGAGGFEPRWLTVPVVQRSQRERIVDKEIDNRLEGKRPWAAAMHATLRGAYGGAPYYRIYAERLQAIFEKRWERLVELDLATIELLRDAFGIRTPMLRSSELPVGGAKSDLVLDICRTVGATVFLGGLGGSRSYLDVAAFERCGIEVRWQQFRHPVYPQHGGGEFVAGLSALDMLVNCGPLGRDMLLTAAGQEEQAVQAA